MTCMSRQFSILFTIIIIVMCIVQHVWVVDDVHVLVALVILVSGDFGFSSEHNKPCLIYTTFYNKIYVYHNITLSSIAPSNLIDFLKEQVRLLNLTKYMLL